MSGNAAPAPNSDIARILLVDDEVRNLDALEELLKSSDCFLVRALSADAALRALLEHDFAAILMDVRMPTISGIELARLIKQRKRSQGIPILFLTAQALDTGEALRGYEAGAVDYLSKPLNSTILKTKIAVFVDLFKKRSELVRAEESLRRVNAELEARVLERTEKLAQANRDLQLSHDRVQEREQRYRQLIKSLPVAIYATDAAGRLTLYNEAAARLWGREPEIGGDTGGSWHKIFRPDGAELSWEESPMGISLAQGQAVLGQEILIERPDGRRRNVLPYPDPLRDAEGKVAGAVNLLLDVTDARQAEAGLRQLAAIVESSDDAIISKNLNSVITSWNRGAERIFGYSAEEVIGLPITLLLPRDRWNEEPGILERLRRGEHIEHEETTYQCKDGRLIEIAQTVSPMKNSEGQVVGVSKIVRDITAQKNAERDLAKAHLEIVAASRAKDDFLAALSHELRTPLNPVLLIASDAAQDAALAPEVRAKFATIRSNAELEARLIDDLLDITRISHGKLSLNLENINLRDVLMAAVETVQADFDHKQVRLNLAEADGNVHMNGDPVRLRQIFWNVLKNAVKFTPAGGEVRVVTELSADRERIIVRIADTGIGLTPEEITSIFNAFSQGQHAAQPGSHRFGGLGLGLTISRMLVELHSGLIHAASPGRNCGATFTIELPVAAKGAVAGAASPADTHPAPGGSKRAARAGMGLRILLVEDHEPTRQALTLLLSRRKHQVLPAMTLAEARGIAGHEKLDLVISDIGLPDGNGYELMAEFRGQFGLQGIALTGYGMEQDVLRSKNAGFIGHLTKPIRIESLDQVLKQYVESDRNPDTPRPLDPGGKTKHD